MRVVFESITRVIDALPSSPHTGTGVRRGHDIVYPRWSLLISVGRIWSTEK